MAEYLARKGKGAMSDEDLGGVVKNALAECVSFIDQLSTERAEATKFFKGAPFGNEEEGRSQVVLTEVADAVDAMIPDLMRIVFPPGEHAVEFVPTRADTVEMAEQQTDYVRYVIEQDNAGFLRTMDVIIDGLVRKLGIYKWGWDESETKAYRQEGITKEQLQLLASDDEVEITSASQREDGTFDVDLTRTMKDGRAWIDSVPPEEFLYNRTARRTGTATILAHRTEKSRGQLLAMDISEKEIDAAGGTGDSPAGLKTNAEEIERHVLDGTAEDPPLGTANDKILYTEAWMTVDWDGDGIAELRRICTIGSGYHVVANDPSDEAPFSVFTPYIEPHALLGRSVADKTMDFQKINSSILRAVLDSLALSIFPRTVYLDGQASVADIMNTAIGAPIRERVAGAVRPLTVPFTGAEALPVLAFTQEVIERRTGKPKGAAGLDADALQSTTKSAADAVLAGGQGQMELIARVFCESALKPLVLGVARLLQKKQPRARMVRLRGGFTNVDPRTWTQQMDVVCNVALGTTNTERKIQMLAAVGEDQLQFVREMGLSNPAVTLPMVLNTRRKVLSLQGIKDGTNYYADLPMDWQPPQPPPPQVDPWVQAEKEMNHVKTMKELAIKQDELALEKQKAEWDHQFQIQKLAADIATKKYIADAGNAQSATESQLAANIEYERHEAELSLSGQDQLHAQVLAHDKHEHEKAMAEQQQAHDQEMAVRAADTADTAATQEPSA